MVVSKTTRGMIRQLVETIASRYAPLRRFELPRGPPEMFRNEKVATRHQDRIEPRRSGLSLFHYSAPMERAREKSMDVRTKIPRRRTVEPASEKFPAWHCPSRGLARGRRVVPELRRGAAGGFSAEAILSLMASDLTISDPAFLALEWIGAIRRRTPRGSRRR